MKKLHVILLSALSLFSSVSSATVNPPNYSKCSAGVKGLVTEMYSDNWSQKVAFKIDSHFYYLSYKTVDANVRTTTSMLMQSVATGATVEIMECQGNDINAIRVYYP